MKLTGKAKNKFESWYLLWIIENKPYWAFNFGADKILEDWESKHLSEQFGVYVDFFDSLGIIINIQKKTKGNQWWILRFSNIRYMRHFNTRQEARIKAIEKANEIYNQKTH